MRTIVDDFIEAAEQRARDYYAACVARSQARREAGAPSLEEMSATYELLVAAGGGEFNPQPDEDALVEAINEELFARGTQEVGKPSRASAPPQNWHWLITSRRRERTSRPKRCAGRMSCHRQHESACA